MAIEDAKMKSVSAISRSLKGSISKETKISYSFWTNIGLKNLFLLRMLHSSNRTVLCHRTSMVLCSNSTMYLLNTSVTKWSVGSDVFVNSLLY